MTLVILPGGQYAEKRLVLNLPSNISIVASQLLHSFTNDSYVTVCFDKESRIPVDIKSRLVFVKKISNALAWLKKK